MFWIEDHLSIHELLIALLHTVFLLSLVYALASIFHVDDLPDPGGPITNTQCLISNSSLNYTTFNIKSGSGQSLFSSQQAVIISSNFISLFLGTSTPGNRSPNNPVKIT